MTRNWIFTVGVLLLTGTGLFLAGRDNGKRRADRWWQKQPCVTSFSDSQGNSFDSNGLIIQNTVKTEAVSPTSKKQKAEEPECSVDSGGMGGTNGFTQMVFKCVDGKYVIDEQATKEANEYMAKYEGRKDELIWAARTRVLTAKEMEEVQGYGTTLFVHPMQSYYQADVEKSFDELLAQQFRLRVIANSHLKSEDVKP